MLLWKAKRYAEKVRAPIFNSVPLKACHRDRSPEDGFADDDDGVGWPGDIGTRNTEVSQSGCPAGQPSFRTMW